MKNKSSALVGGLLAAVTLFCIWYFGFRVKPDACEYYATEEINVDIFMGKLLEQPFKAKVYPNWYKCHQPQRGDIVRYALGNPPENYTRMLAAVGGETIRVVADAQKRGWNLIVNDEIQMSGESPYVFGVNGVHPTIGLYMGAEGTRTLGEKEIVMLGWVGPGFNDSGLFGLFESSFAKKVQLPSEQQKIFDETFKNMFISVDKLAVKPIVGSLPQPGIQAQAKKKAPVAPKTQKPKKNR